ncbi:glycosyl hydrolase 108 family protein [Sphingomonas parapaucimobilis]|uniref:TtsA-like Glycoside hydrolase family 108 domain-containing protein n=1 Tax=Sphingomonas parapaucimobilis NBRC 15100 TaxID=1219049 RepID=A0A0A1W6A4_9SPHN|nr:glycosyl hydrolase 108 family protein [Sphingomonas parapaucimobilis]GAM00707.1 hypothetical protein SP5_035_01070 [Sphingomonas parapaucimobilis NBRC 15100]
MSDRRSSVFLDNRPDSRKSGQAPDAPPAPVSLGEIASAQWTLGRQDFMGAPQQAEMDAYGPIVTALGKRRPASWWDMLGGHNRYVQVGQRSAAINSDNVWADVQAERERDPDFLKDIPAKNGAEFTQWVQREELRRRRAAQGVVARESGIGQKAFGFGVGMATGLVDPINLSAMVLTGGSGAAPTIWRGMAREALINGAIEGVEMPQIMSNRAAFGEDMSAGDVALDIGMALAGGAAFHAGGRAIGAGARAAAASPAGRAAGRAMTPLALRMAELRNASDIDVVRAFADAVPAEYRTPDQQAAIHVVEREADIDASNPFVRNAAGDDEHASRLEAALRAMLAPDAARGTLAASTALSSGTAVPFTPRALPAARPNLSPDRVIRFVINDLEGGAQVVRYGAADGGTTKYGIAAKFNPGVDVANLSEGQAAAIARRKYWFPELDRADPRVAAVAFDAGYIAGPKVGKRILAESGGDPAKALALYRQHLEHVADTVAGKAKYRNGWRKRVDRLERMTGASGERVQLEPLGFAADAADDVAVAQRALDQATMDAELAAAERARVEPDIAERDAAPEDMSAGEGSAVMEMGEPSQIDSVPPPVAPIDPEARAAVRRYIADTRGSLQPAKIAKALGLVEDDAARIVEALAADPRGGLVRQGKAGRIIRRPVRRAPIDLFRFIADRGGLRDDEGHSLIAGRGLDRFVPGAGPLFREGGMSLDRARELAAEAGYFHDRAPDDAMASTTTDDFIELLQRADRDPVYTLADLEAVTDREARAAASEQAAMVRSHIDARLTEHGFSFDRDQTSRAAALMIERDMEPDEAIRAVVNQDIAEALDDARMEADSDRYDLLADDFQAIADADRGIDGDRLGRAVDGTDEGQGGAGVGEPRGAGEGGAALDERQASGLAGPAPLDDVRGRAFDDPDGPGAVALVDSLIHDLRAQLDEVLPYDPAQREFRSLSPVGTSRVMDIAAARREALGQAYKLKLGDALYERILAYEGGDAEFGPIRIVEGHPETLEQAHGSTARTDFRIDDQGVERSLRDILDEIDADDAAIKAARNCL